MMLLKGEAVVVVVVVVVAAAAVVLQLSLIVLLVVLDGSPGVTALEIVRQGQAGKVVGFFLKMGADAVLPVLKRGGPRIRRRWQIGGGGGGGGRRRRRIVNRVERIYEVGKNFEAFQFFIKKI